MKKEKLIYKDKLRFAENLGNHMVTISGNTVRVIAVSVTSKTKNGK